MPNNCSIVYLLIKVMDYGEVEYERFHVTRLSNATSKDFIKAIAEQNHIDFIYRLYPHGVDVIKGREDKGEISQGWDCPLQEAA